MSKLSELGVLGLVPRHPFGALRGLKRGGAILLAAKYQGGKELHDGSGHLPRDADGYYLSRSTGARLVIDAGYAETDAVGAPKVYGLLGAVVVGSPATGRRSGFDTTSDTDYVILALSNDGGSALVRVDRGPTSITTTKALLYGADTDPRWGLAVVTRSRVQAGGAGDGTIAQTGSDATIQNAVGYLGITVDHDTGVPQYTGRAMHWNDSGTQTHDSTEQTISATAGTSAGTYYLGRAKSTGFAWDGGPIEVAFGWDGAALTEAQMQAVVDDLVGGATVDEAAANAAVTPDLATDGLICGAYDPANPTELFTESGTGADVIVAQPATAAQTLGALYVGGKELHDGTGHLPRLDNGWYTSRDGVLLSVDDGYSAGDAIGDPAMYVGIIGKGVGTVYGAPASARRSGFDQLDYTAGASTGYVQLTLDEDAHSFIAETTMTATPALDNPFFGIDASGYRWGMQIVGQSDMNLRLYDNTTVKATATVTSGAAYASGETFVAGGGADSVGNGNVSLTVWDDGGTQLGTATDVGTAAVTSLAGEYALGRGRGGGGFITGTVNCFGGFDGTHHDSTAFGTMEARIRAGDDVDTLAATFGGVWSDGIVCGAYTTEDETILYTESGTGDAVIVGEMTSAVAGVLYQGGKELHDGSGHLPRDRDGYYLSRTTGTRLAVDAGYNAGDAVGDPKLYGLLSATIVGTPATARRSGFDTATDTAYGLLSFDTSQLSMLAYANRATTAYRSFVDSVAGDPRVQFGLAANAQWLRTRTTDAATTEVADSGAVLGSAGTPHYHGGTVDGSTGDLEAYAWSDAGTYLGGASHTGTVAVDVAGPVYLGRQNTTSYAWNDDIHWAIGWDGVVKTQAELKAIIDAYKAGTTIDELAAGLASDAALVTDGIICGAYDADDETILFTLSGSGADVVVG